MSLWDTFQDQYEKKKPRMNNIRRGGRRGGGGGGGINLNYYHHADATKNTANGHQGRPLRRQPEMLPAPPYASSFRDLSKKPSFSSSWISAILQLPSIHHHYHHNRNNHIRTRQRFGVRLAQQNAFNVASSSSSPSCIYRRPEDWSSQQTFVNCLFLNNETALACDMTGKVDVIRLPSSSNSEAGEHSNNGKIVGTPLTSRLEALPSLKGTSTFKLKSIRNGTAFAMGMPCGSCRILSTERTMDWATDLKECPFKQQQPQTNSTEYVQAAWSINSPRRRYYRDYSSVQGTLSSMIQNNNNNNNSSSNNHTSLLLSEIPNWEDSSSSSFSNQLPNFFPYQRPSNHASMWDFREASPGALLSLHVDSQFDCFSILRIGDDRINNKQTKMAAATGIVCIDRTSKDVPPNHEEHITACTFVSDNIVATAHTSLLRNNNNITTTGHHQHHDNVVKLWDLRMMTNDSGTTTTRQQRSSMVNLVRLSTFPETQTTGLEPIATKSVLYSSTYDHDDENCNQFGTVHPGNDAAACAVITGLSSSQGMNSNHDGNLVVTMQSTTGGGRTGEGQQQEERRPSSIVEHHLLDLGRMEVTKAVRQYNTNPDCNPVYTMSGSNNFMACYTGGGSSSSSDGSSECNTSMPSIAIYDLIANNRGGKGKRKIPILSGQKRNISSSKSNNSKSQCGGKGKYLDSCMISHQWNPALKDRYGLETTLSSLEINHDGTALLGGSVDGDLFLWR